MTAPPVPIVSGSTWLARAVVVNHDTDVETEVGVISASVTIDRKSDARRVVDAEITPDVDPNLLIAPHRLKLFAGYRVQGVDYWAPLAHVRFGRRSRSPMGPWRISQAMSFEALVAAAGFWRPYIVDAGTSMINAMTYLITSAIPWATVQVKTTTDAKMLSQTFERERWQAIAGRETSIATALSVDVGCDGTGAFIIQDPPSGDAVWDVSEGRVLVDYSETADPGDVKNIWITYSDHPDVSPIRGIAGDDDPLSPTRHQRWGQSVGYYSSPLLTTQDMCQKAAETRLLTTRGLTVSLDLSAVPNPWLDIGDVISSTRGGVSTSHQIDKITHSLAPDQPMKLTAAARTVAVNA